MLERTTARTLPLVGRMTEATPVVTGCCNMCRSCISANAAAVLGWVGGLAVRPLRRRLGRG